LPRRYILRRVRPPNFHTSGCSPKKDPGHRGMTGFQHIVLRTLWAVRKPLIAHFMYKRASTRLPPITGQQQRQNSPVSRLSQRESPLIHGQRCFWILIWPRSQRCLRMALPSIYETWDLYWLILLTLSCSTNILG
jgi:hypothetical protein